MSTVNPKPRHYSTSPTPMPSLLLRRLLVPPSLGTVLLTGCTRTHRERGVEPVWRSLSVSSLAIGTTTRSDLLSQLVLPALLEADLPAALNRLQNPDHGSYGLQQQATPTSVGQRTLEFCP